MHPQHEEMRHSERHTKKEPTVNRWVSTDKNIWKLCVWKALSSENLRDLYRRLTGRSVTVPIWLPGENIGRKLWYTFSKGYFVLWSLKAKVIFSHQVFKSPLVHPWIVKGRVYLEETAKTPALRLKLLENSMHNSKRLFQLFNIQLFNLPFPRLSL